MTADISTWMLDPIEEFKFERSLSLINTQTPRYFQYIAKCSEKIGKDGQRSVCTSVICYLTMSFSLIIPGVSTVIFVILSSFMCKMRELGNLRGGI